MCNLDLLFDHLEKIENNTDNLDAPACAAAAIDFYVQISSEQKAAAEIFESIKRRLKTVIGEIMIETGETAFISPMARCYIPKPSKSVRYDVKALDRLLIHDPDLCQKILPYRQEQERAGHLTIRAR